MQEYIQFVINHWVLWLALVLLILLIIVEEFRGKIGGLPRLSASDLTQLINTDQAVVIDIRDNDAFAAGHITGSVNIPFSDLEANAKKLEKYKTKTIVIVSGAELSKSTKALQAAGYNLATLNGGITGWRQAGLPLVKN